MTDGQRERINKIKERRKGKPPKKLPTISELEAILNAEDTAIELLPNGEVRAIPTIDTDDRDFLLQLVQRLDEECLQLKTLVNGTTQIIEEKRAEATRLEEQRGEYASALLRLNRAWDEGWDCSQDPGHSMMNEACREIFSVTKNAVLLEIQKTAKSGEGSNG